METACISPLKAHYQPANPGSVFREVALGGRVGLWRISKATQHGKWQLNVLLSSGITFKPVGLASLYYQGSVSEQVARNSWVRASWFDTRKQILGSLAAMPKGNTGQETCATPTTAIPHKNSSRLAKTRLCAFWRTSRYGDRYRRNIFVTNQFIESG
jgi:hypothetical protein